MTLPCPCARLPGGPTTARSLTQVEAEERAALIDGRRYDIAVDMRGLLEGRTVGGDSTIDVRCREPGASTFVDCAAEVRSATLNGATSTVDTVADGRMPLPDLAGDNVLVVASAQSDTGRGAASSAPSTRPTSSSTSGRSFEPDAARRVWACFDQPDLKAPHGFIVIARELDGLSNRAPGRVSRPRGRRRGLWTFPDTPPLSTYVVVVNAGPFDELREQRGGHGLGLYCRQSLRRYLDRDADELFSSPSRGWRSSASSSASRSRRSATTRSSCPTWAARWRTGAASPGPTPCSTGAARPTRSAQRGATVLLHEMAHMWFGDLVTMRWWDDLWLNEAFASWAADLGRGDATELHRCLGDVPGRVELTATAPTWAPPPTRSGPTVPDVAQAMANFDAITYAKGQSVLKQLVGVRRRGARSSRACAPTSATTPGATPASTT